MGRVYSIHNDEIHTDPATGKSRIIGLRNYQIVASEDEARMIARVVQATGVRLHRGSSGRLAAKITFDSSYVPDHWIKHA